jgi:hypothetical protein
MSTIVESFRRDYYPESSALDTFLGKLEARCLTDPSDRRANFFNVRRGKRYHLNSTLAEELFLHLNNCRKKNIPMHYTEKQAMDNARYGGIMLDFDIKYTVTKPIENEDYFLSSDGVNDLEMNIACVVKAMLRAEDLKTRFFLIESGKVRMLNDTTAKAGFHLLIPNTYVTRKFKRALHEKLVKDEQCNESLKDIITQLPNYKELADSNVIDSAQFLVWIMQDYEKEGVHTNIYK